MQKTLSPFLVATLCGLLAGPVPANAADDANAPVVHGSAAASAAAHVNTANDVDASAAVAPGTRAILLTEDALDAVDAGGLGASGYGLASADRGHALSVSATQIVSSRIVTISLSQSLALAIGLHPQTTTAALARAF